MRSGDSGFTLVETLVALALVAVVSLLLFEGMRFTNVAWQTRAARSDALTAAISTGDILREIAANAIDPALQQNVVGDADSMQMITVLPTPDASERRARIVVVRHVADQLVAESRDIGADRPGSRRVLARGIEDIGFRYLDRTGEWTETWDAPERLPRLIEMRLTYEGLRHWPAIVVAPGASPVPD